MEMNMHFPQTVQTMNELRDLAYIPYMIISPKDGVPIIGMVQDVLLGAYRITDDKVKVDPITVANLQMVNSNFSGKMPDMNKTYSGKEVFSLILPPNINTSVGKMKVENSLITSGKLGKNTFKMLSKGLLPIIYHDHGANVAMRFMDNTQRLICRWLMLDGFSVGISDLIMSEENNNNIKSVIKRLKQKAYEKIDNFRKGKIANNTIFSDEKFMEMELINVLNEINREISKICMDGKTLNDDNNRMMNMVNSGSKGKESNVTQIMGCVAQVKVEGKRIPYGFTGRTLPHFAKYDDGPEARGFVENGFIHGLTPQEVFFHAMGGREGLIDTAVKTSDTGYIQRRLVKSMEDAKIYYDFTVRNATGVVLQFVYGEDGMDGTKIERQEIPFVDMNPVQLAHNYLLTENDQLSVYLLKDAATQTKKNLNLSQDIFEQITVDRHELITKVFKNKKVDTLTYPIPFKRIIDDALFKLTKVNVKRRKSDLDIKYVVDKLNWMKENLIVRKCCMFFRILLNTYLNPKQLIINYGFNRSIFDYIVDRIIRCFKLSVAHPGEMVGVVAAQTIGEMGTQMTLDSFHVSGTDAAVNATSGVPRLKELLSVSKNIKTPMMNIYLKDDIATIYTDMNQPEPDEQAIELAKYGALGVKNDIEIVRIADIIEKSEIIWDDGQLTNIEDDKQFVSIYNQFKNSCAEGSLVLRMVFRKDRMLMFNLRMIDIFTSLNTIYRNCVECIYSDDNAEQCIMRIKLIGEEIYGDEDHVTLLKAIEHNIVYNMLLKGVKGIKKVSMEKVSGKIEYHNNTFKKVTRWTLNTDGSNMRELLMNKNVDATKTRSNNIREIYEVLGIEAARKALTIELESVIGEDKMNYRHLSLLVDTMTSRGGLMSIDRHGINRSDVGPLAKSSFEETTDMLVNASIFSEYDNLNGVSANVMLGHKAPCGTGDFEVMIDEDKFTELMKDTVVEHVNEPITSIEEESDDEDIFVNVSVPNVDKNKNKACFKRLS